MFKKIKTTTHLIFIILFISYAIVTYFSNETQIKINQNRAVYSKKFNSVISGLSLLKSDTDNVIKYNIKNSEENKIKKRYFWNLLKDE
jgi:hypothetical protein|tara:strand:+ start:156 stop:419 length:264 start_codon:yes stop_codon:yes gene_type:complete